LLRILSIGFMASSIGLLINALYIDVYAASKVAFSYWGLTGLYLASLYVISPDLIKIGWVEKLNKIVDQKFYSLKQLFRRSKITYRKIEQPGKKKKKRK